MFGLSTRMRWLIFGIGTIPVLLAFGKIFGVIDLHPNLESILIPYGLGIGILLMVIGHGFTEESEKPNGSGGLDGSPGMGESKKGFWGDGPFGGGDGGGGDGGGS